MHALILFLQFLDVLALMLDVLWFTIALHQHAFQKLYAILTSTFDSFSSALPICQPTPPPPAPRRQSTVLYRPTFPMHNLCYIVITHAIASLPASSRAAFTPHLRGTAFATLAQSLIANEPAPILARHGIALARREQRKIEYLATLPELVVTPPEDGNRKPMRGERGGKRVKVYEGLVPPKRVGKLGKERRAEEKRLKVLGSDEVDAGARV